MAAARILVVGDQRPVLEMVSRTLCREGYDVLCADGANQALEIVKSKGSIDVVLSDVEMPAMRGTDLVREISRMSARTASVLMSGSKAASAEIPAGVPLIRKPFTTAQLIATVEAAVVKSANARAQLSRELHKSALFQRQSSELASQLNRAVRDAEETLRKIREAREGRQRHPGEK